MTKRNIFLGLSLLVPLIVFSQKNTERFTYVPSGSVILETDGPGSTFFTPRIRATHINGFEVGRQITLKMYKQFLSAMRQDSGEAIYSALLPDSTIGTLAQVREYLTEPQFWGAEKNVEVLATDGFLPNDHLAKFIRAHL